MELETYYSLRCLFNAQSGLRSTAAELAKLRRRLDKMLRKNGLETARPDYDSIVRGKEKLCSLLNGSRLSLLEIGQEELASASQKLVSSVRHFPIMAPDYTPMLTSVLKFADLLPIKDDSLSAALGHLANLAKIGYYPTDPAHVAYLSQALVFPENSEINLLDPCCGEGLALEQIAQGRNCHTFGAELDDSRARQACEHLERVAMGSYFYSRISHNAFQLLYLNPPYLSTIGANGTRTREERHFLIETIPHLAERGVLIYIIPYYRLTPDIARVLCDNFEKLSVYRFCGKEFTKFHQIAVLGCRIPRQDGSRLAPAFLSRVEILEQIPTLDKLPPESYALPPATAKVQIFYGSVFNEVELARQLESSALCKKLYREENVLDRMDKQPLLPLKVGQVGLIAGSGMVNGYAGDEVPHVIKGYMQPEETITVTSAPQQEPNASQMMYQHNKKSNHLRINILTPHGIKSLS